jgi:hypothetical protein
MADRKVTDLVELGVEDLTDDDYGLVSQASSNASKKIRLKQLGGGGVAPYTVLSGESVTAGQGLELIQGGVRAGQGRTIELNAADKIVDAYVLLRGRIVKLDETRLFAVYAQGNGVGDGYGVVITIAGDGSRSYGTPVLFRSGVMSNFSACLVDTDKIAVSYMQNANGKCIIATISGTVISFGSEVVFNASPSLYTDVIALTTGKIAVVYARSTTDVKIIAATVSGTVPTFGTEATVYAATGSYCSLVRMADGKGMVSFNAPNLGVSVAVFTVSGTTITVSTPVTVYPLTTSGDEAETQIEYLGDDLIALCFMNLNAISSNQGVYAQVLRVYDTTVIGGRAVLVRAQTVVSPGISITKMTPNRVAVTLSDVDDSDNGKVYILDIINGAFQVKDFAQYSSAATMFNKIIAISSTRLYAIYADSADSQKGYNAVIEYSEFVGIALKSAAAGDVVSAAYAGTVSITSLSLQAGGLYYIDESGSLSRNAQRTFAGTAVSSTVLRIGEVKGGVIDARSFAGAKYRAEGHAGYGSTNNKIPYFTSITENVLGTINTIANSASLGWSMTVNVAGVYSVYYASRAAAAAAHSVGVTKNSAQLTTAILSTTLADRLAVDYQDVATAPVDVAVTVFLNIGDVLRIHTDGGTPSATNVQILEVTLITPIQS